MMKYIARFAMHLQSHAWVMRHKVFMQYGSQLTDMQALKKLLDVILPELWEEAHHSKFQMLVGPRYIAPRYDEFVAHRHSMTAQIPLIFRRDEDSAEVMGKILIDSNARRTVISYVNNDAIEHIVPSQVILRGPLDYALRYRRYRNTLRKQAHNVASASLGL